MRKNKLYIFEFKDEIDAFLRQGLLEDIKRGHVLAILPEAQAYLKHLGVDFSNTYEYFDKGSHEQASLKIDEINGFFGVRLRIVDDIGVTFGYNFAVLTYLRAYIDYLLWLTAVISNACAKLDIASIAACVRSNAHSPDPLVSHQEGYAGEISKLLSGHLDIDFRGFAAQDEKDESPFPRRLKSALNQAIKLILFRISFRYFKGKKFILFTSAAYNLDRIMADFRRAFPDVKIALIGKKGLSPKSLMSERDLVPLSTVSIGARTRVFADRLARNIGDIFALEECRAALTYKGADLTDIVLNKLRGDILPNIVGVFNQTSRLDKFFERNKPKLIVSQMSRYFYYNLGELAALRRITSVLISHGSHVPPRNKYEMIEWKEHGLGLINTKYQYAALQSPWAEAYADKIPLEGRRLITGPLLFAKTDESAADRLRRELLPEHKDKIIITHADTPRQRVAIRFYIYQTVDEYLYNLNALIRAVEKVKEMHLVIRFRPLHYLSAQDIVPLLLESDCYTIQSGGTFEEWLAVSDMLVSYSSTTIEEALQNRVPVLQLDTQGKYCHIDGQPLAPGSGPKVDSAYYVNDEKNIEWALDWLVKNHFSKRPPDSLWERHLFTEAQKLSLTEYFSPLFSGADDQIKKAK